MVCLAIGRMVGGGDFHGAGHRAGSGRIAAGGWCLSLPAPGAGGAIAGDCAGLRACLDQVGAGRCAADRPAAGGRPDRAGPVAPGTARRGTRKAPAGDAGAGERAGDPGADQCAIGARPGRVTRWSRSAPAGAAGAARTADAAWWLRFCPCGVVPGDRGHRLSPGRDHDPSSGRGGRRAGGCPAGAFGPRPCAVARFGRGDRSRLCQRRPRRDPQGR